MVTIPQMVILDPEGMAFHHKVPLSDIHSKTDFELLVDQQCYQDRIKGNLPAIDLLGRPYYVDLRRDELRPREYPGLPSIPISRLKCIDDLENLGFLYEPKTGTIPNIDLQTLTEIPKDCHYLRIPALSKLDPVGYARKLGLNVHDFLRQQPILPRLKAEVMDWHETSYMKAVLENKSKFMAEHVQPKLQKHRKKKGKGI